MDIERLFMQVKEDPAYLKDLKREISRRNDIVSFIRLAALHPPSSYLWEGVCGVYNRALTLKIVAPEYLISCINQWFAHWPNKVRVCSVTIGDMRVFDPNQIEVLDRFKSLSISKRINIHLDHRRVPLYYVLDNAPHITDLAIYVKNSSSELDLRPYPNIKSLSLSKGYVSYSYFEVYVPPNLTHLKLNKVGQGHSDFLSYVSFKNTPSGLDSLSLDLLERNEDLLNERRNNNLDILFDNSPNLKSILITDYSTRREVNHRRVTSYKKDVLEEISDRSTILERVSLTMRTFSEPREFLSRLPDIRFPNLTKFKMAPVKTTDAIDWIKPENFPKLESLHGYLTNPALISKLVNLKSLELAIINPEILNSFFSKKSFNPSVEYLSVNAVSMFDASGRAISSRFGRGTVKYDVCFPNLKSLTVIGLSLEKQYSYVCKQGVECKLTSVCLIGTSSARISSPSFPESITYFKGCYEEKPDLAHIFSKNVCLMFIVNGLDSYDRFFQEERKNEGQTRVSGY